MRLEKGVYNEHRYPPAPRYSTTWDVTKVTDYLKTLFPLDTLNLKTLKLKTVMPCALSSAQREQKLCALDLNCMRKSLDGFSFVIAELKTSKPGKSVTLKFGCLPDKPLCTKCTLAAYISLEKMQVLAKSMIFHGFSRHEPLFAPFFRKVKQSLKT